MRKYIKESQQKKVQCLKKQLGMNKGLRVDEYARARLEDGVFWIGFADFVKHFSFVYACRFFDDSWHKDLINGKWIDGNDGGCTNFKNFAKNPHYTLEVTEDSVKLFIMLIQVKERLADGKNRAVQYVA
ncbi:MAG: hypothetical protein P4M11_07565 [Candidatus Pacebacteria bacterium]|nr:hypothetical protein [Candidatus Paceibacterota bacterium]